MENCVFTFRTLLEQYKNRECVVFSLQVKFPDSNINSKQSLVCHLSEENLPPSLKSSLPVSLFIHIVVICIADREMASCPCVVQLKMCVCLCVFTVRGRLLVRCVSITAVNWWTSTALSVAKRSTCWTTWRFAWKTSRLTGRRHARTHPHAHNPNSHKIYTHQNPVGCNSCNKKLDG